MITFLELANMVDAWALMGWGGGDDTFVNATAWRGWGERTITFVELANMVDAYGSDRLGWRG